MFFWACTQTLIFTNENNSRSNRPGHQGWMPSFCSFYHFCANNVKSIIPFEVLSNQTLIKIYNASI